MRTRKTAIGGILVGLALFGVTAGASFAQAPPETPAMPPGPMPGAAMSHEQMHQMMDAMHGEGASQRMHEAMGPDGEKLMEQCVAMMNMMRNMQGMMGGGGMPGMMGGQDGRSMPGMMDGMMGR